MFLTTYEPIAKKSPNLIMAKTIVGERMSYTKYFITIKTKHFSNKSIKFNIIEFLSKIHFLAIYLD